MAGWSLVGAHVFYYVVCHKIETHFHCDMVKNSLCTCQDRIVKSRLGYFVTPKILTLAQDQQPLQFYKGLWVTGRTHFVEGEFDTSSIRESVLILNKANEGEKKASKVTLPALSSDISVGEVKNKWSTSFLSVEFHTSKQKQEIESKSRDLHSGYLGPHTFEPSAIYSVKFKIWQK